MSTLLANQRSRCEPTQPKICLWHWMVILLLCLPFGSVMAAPLVVLDNNTGQITTGGSGVAATLWRAIIFSTPSSEMAEIVSIELGLNCYSDPSPAPACAYPTTRQLQIDLYSVVGGQPNSQLYTIPLQAVNLTAASQIYTFSIPNWRLSAGTSYALVLKSVGSDPNNVSQSIKWAGLVNNTVPSGLNGFSYVGTSLINPPGTPAWTASGATDQVVVIYANLLPAVPMLSQWTQLLLALMTITLVGWHFHRERSY